MSDIPHIGFILAAYGITAIVLVGMVAAVLIDGRNQARLLAKLEARRASRRPDNLREGSQP